MHSRSACAVGLLLLTLGVASAGRAEEPTRSLAPGGDSAPQGDVPASASALSPGALALQDPGDDELEPLSFSREGAYVGVGGSFALENFDVPGDQKNAQTLMFRAGYRGYSWLSVDMLGEVIFAFEGDDSLDNDVNGYAVTVNARVIAPLGRLEPWAMFGLGFLDMDEDESRSSSDDLALRSAVGFDLYLTPRWAIYGEAAYMLGTGDVQDYDFATFGGGLLFRF